MARKKIVETYGSTSQRVVGWVAFTIVVVFLVDVAIQWAGREAWVPAAVALLIGVLVWITSIRPLVIAYEGSLRVRNFLKTADLDLAAIESAELRGELIIHPADHELTPVKAIAVSARRPDSTRGIGGMRNAFGMGAGQNAAIGTELDVAGQPTASPATQATRTAASQRPTKGDHAKGKYAVDRIEAMATKARNLTPEQVDWKVYWAIPECAGLAVAVVLFVLAIALR